MNDLRSLFPHIDYKTVTLIVVLFAFVFLLIIILVPINITAKGEGRTVLSNAIRNIQATESTTILRIYVEENQLVKKGDLLIELNSKLLENELKNLEHTQTILMLSNERISALLESCAPAFEKITSDELLVHSAKSIYEQEKNTFAARQMCLKNQIQSKIEEENTLEESIKLFQKLSAAAKDFLDRLILLIKKGVISQMSKYDMQKQYIDASSHLQMQITALRAAKNMRIAYEQELATVKHEFERTNRLHFEENIKNIDVIEKDIKNLKERIKKMKIYADADGVIFNLTAHENGVVTTSQIIAQLVPQNDAIEVEAIMSKANCGLVEVGNKSIIKLQAFPYQIYGTLKGNVKSISPVSMNDATQKNGVSVRIKLNTQKINTEKNEIALRPLMPLEAVVNVSKVCIAKYLLMYMMKK